jgi:hypothetical protein
MIFAAISNSLAVLLVTAGLVQTLALPLLLHRN